MSCSNTTYKGLECHPIPHCATTLIIPTGYTERDVIIDIENSKGEVRRLEGTTDYGESFSSVIQSSYEGTVTAVNLPKGYFNEYAGTFRVFIKDPDNNEEILPIIVPDPCDETLDYEYDYFNVPVIKRLPLEDDREATVRYKKKDCGEIEGASRGSLSDTQVDAINNLPSNVVSEIATVQAVADAAQSTADGKLTITSNLSDLDNVVTARSSLGLGNSAILDRGDSNSDVAYGDVVFRGTVAELNALGASSLPNNKDVVILNVDGDFEGRYKLQALGTSTADGGIIKDFTHYQGVRDTSQSSYILAEWFGCTGDGRTDDTAAFQAAIDYCKDRPGSHLHFKKGTYILTDSIDITNPDTAGSLQGGFYGFTITGDDKINTRFEGRCAGKVVLDFTGKGRMTLKDFSVSNYTDDANNPSCGILMARNLNNESSGTHACYDITVRGYFTTTCVQSSSSETNKWINCEFQPFSSGCDAFTLTQQILNGVNSEYIDLTGHTFIGGNTWTSFIGCSLNAAILDTGKPLLISGVDNLTLHSCYTKTRNGTIVDVLDDCDNVTFVNHRDEGEGETFIEIQDGVTLNGLNITGKVNAGIYGHDNSTLSNSIINTGFLGGAPYSFDLYDSIDNKMINFTNQIRIRNSGRGTEIKISKPEGSLDLPTGNSEAGQVKEYILKYTGGNSVYNPIISNQSQYHRRLERNLQVGNFTIKEDASDNVSGTVNPNLRNGCNFTYNVTGNTTIGEVFGSKLAPIDEFGELLIITIIQDATGGRNITWDSDYDLKGLQVDTSANAKTTIMFIKNSSGSNPDWIATNAYQLRKATAIADLSQTISDPPTQVEVQSISDKINALLAVMRTANLLDT